MDGTLVDGGGASVPSTAKGANGAPSADGTPSADGGKVTVLHAIERVLMASMPEGADPFAFVKSLKPSDVRTKLLDFSLNAAIISVISAGAQELANQEVTLTLTPALT